MRAVHTLIAAAAALCFTALPSQAQGHGHANSASKGKVPPGIERQAEQGHVPPGLAKKGGLPPGQAKKIYSTDQGLIVLRDIFGRHGYSIVRTRSRGDVRYVYYRGSDGRIHRATVLPGEDRLVFRDVPSLLLREIMARLY